MGRVALEDFSLGDYRLPAGTTVLISQFITHRDARYFPDPLSFTPERFLAKEKATFPKSIYFPFGAGARQCVGESFAWTESALVLTTLAQQWRLRMDPTQRIAVQPLIHSTTQARNDDAGGATNPVFLSSGVHVQNSRCPRQ